MSMKIKKLSVILFALSMMISGCDRIDVADQTELKIIPPVSSYNPNVESYWKFDAQPSFNYDSKIGHTNYAMSTVGWPVDYFGKFKEAYQPSIGNYVYLPAGNTLIYDSKRFLVEAWIRSANVAGTLTVLSYCDTNVPDGWSCRLSGGIPQIWYVYEIGVVPTVKQVTSSLSVPDDSSWHYIAFVFGQQENASSSKKIYFYVDGNYESVDIPESDFPFVNSSMQLNFGFEWNSVGGENNIFNGSIDDMAYWSLPEYISWSSIERTLIQRNSGMQYKKSNIIYY